MSLNAQNKILQMMALKVWHGIASDKAEFGHYSILADKSTDTNNIKLHVICIRWVDKEMTVCEEYIGLMPVARQMLLHMNLRIQDAHGQCYDECSTMTGTKMELLHKSRNGMKNVC